MTQDVSSFVERYQLIYERDPNSKVFAPLAEAYRRMGLIDEAIDLAKKGVQKHPHFASGRVALGKCYFQKSAYEKALDELKAAVDLSPENLLAHQLMAECYLKLKKPGDALSGYKMVLFLNPHDARAAEIVRKLEAQVYADTKPETWAEEDFSMEKLSEVAPKAASMAPETAPDHDSFEREIALLDTRMSRGDWTAARKQLGELLKLHPQNQELVDRKKRMDELSNSNLEVAEWITPLENNEKQGKIEKLQNWLQAIEARRKA